MDEQKDASEEEGGFGDVYGSEKVRGRQFRRLNCCGVFRREGTRGKESRVPFVFSLQFTIDDKSSGKEGKK